MRGFREFLREEDGVGVVELILIVVVLIGLVALFQDNIEKVVTTIFSTISKSLKKIR